ncbi:MAG: hypothetical protein ACRD1B_00720 [Thermoanaerobaculia bacterium]
MLRRVKRRAIALAGVFVLGAFLVGPRSGASLTICAGVVISSFLALEKVTERLVPERPKPGRKTIALLLLVSAVSLTLLGVVLWRWKDFDAVAGAAGLSVVVVAVIPEIWAKSEKR